MPTTTRKQGNIEITEIDASGDKSEDNFSITAFNAKTQVIDASLTLQDRRTIIAEQRRTLGKKTFLEIAVEVDTEETAKELLAAKRQLEHDMQMEKLKESQNTPITKLERAIKARVQNPNLLEEIGKWPKQDLKKLFTDFQNLRVKRGITLDEQESDIAYVFLLNAVNQPQPSPLTRIRKRFTLPKNTTNE